MKNILVATDFSPAALNAAKYAAQLAKISHARLHIVHVYHLAIVNGEVPIVADMKSFEKECYNKLEAIGEELAELYEVVPILKADVGFTVEVINDYVANHSINLVVMGMKGYGAMEKVFIGSTTVTYLKHTTAPLLVIPEFSTYEVPKRILFSTDLKEIEINSLELLKEIAELYDSKILILNITEAEQLPSYEKSLAGIQIDRYLDELDHLFLFPHGKDPIDGIDNYLEKNGADWITMVPHKHNLFERMFGKSMTKKMIYHTHIPLLILPEAKRKNL